jgi:small subunit ribosomal protein S8e
VQVDAQPFKQWYLKKYGVDLGKKAKDKKGKADKEKAKDADDDKGEKRSRHVIAKQKYRDSNTNCRRYAV